MDNKLLEIIICPRCHGKLDLIKSESILLCQFDRLSYPIEDGLPVLMVENSTPLTKTKIDELLNR